MFFFCNKWHIPNRFAVCIYVIGRYSRYWTPGSSRRWPINSHLFVRSSVRLFIHPFLTLVFQNWLIRFFCFVTQSPGYISAQRWWSPIFWKKFLIVPNWEKRVRNYSQMHGERPVEDIENSNKFHLRGNIYVHFFVNTITDIIYWNFHIFYRNVCRKYKNQHLLPLPP